MSNRRQILIVRVIFAMILLLTVFVATVIMQDDEPDIAQDDCPIEERLAETFAPLNVENMRSQSFRSLQACDVYVTFTMAPESLDALREIAGADFQEVENITEQAEFTSLLPSLDWPIRDDQPYLYSSFDRQTIAVDTSDETRYRVYVVYWVD